VTGLIACASSISHNQAGAGDQDPISDRGSSGCNNTLA
jgi:hypothetical protein